MKKWVEILVSLKNYVEISVRLVSEMDGSEVRRLDRWRDE